MKENVAIIFDGLYGGGAERIAGLLSIYLHEKYNVFLFIEKTDRFVYDYAGTVIDCGKYGTKYMEYYVMKAKKKYNIRYSISFMEFFNYINIKTKQQDIVIISERCNFAFVTPYSFYDELMIKRLYQYADHIVAISNGVKKELINQYKVQAKKITTIYNFFEKDSIIKKSNINDIKIEKKAEKLIINIGRLEEQKNHKRLLYQFKHLRDEGEDVQLIIIGSGNLQNQLNIIIQQLNVEDFVTIIPYMSNPFQILKQATVFVLSSQYEGLGNVLLEAMCLGVPIVSVDCPSGPAELLSDKPRKQVVDTWEKCERGILVTTSDSEDELGTTNLSDAIKYLINDDDYRLSMIKNELEFINSYSNKEILSKWLDVLNIAQNAKTEKWNAMNRKNVIYGAGEYCRILIKERGRENIYAIAVSSKWGNPEFVDEIPVLEITELMDIKDEINIILGIYNFDIVQDVCKTLKEKGFNYVERPMLIPKERYG